MSGQRAFIAFLFNLILFVIFAPPHSNPASDEHSAMTVCRRETSSRVLIPVFGSRTDASHLFGHISSVVVNSARGPISHKTKMLHLLTRYIRARGNGNLVTSISQAHFPSLLLANLPRTSSTLNRKYHPDLSVT